MRGKEWAIVASSSCPVQGSVVCSVVNRDEVSNALSVQVISRLTNPYIDQRACLVQLGVACRLCRALQDSATSRWEDRHDGKRARCPAGTTALR
jgi:hypothetical protein